MFGGHKACSFETKIGPMLTRLGLDENGGSFPKLKIEQQT